MRFQQFLERKGEKAHRDAVAMGLQYKGFGYWADPNTGEAKYKTVNDQLVPVEPDVESDLYKGDDPEEGPEASGVGGGQMAVPGGAASGAMGMAQGSGLGLGGPQDGMPAAPQKKSGWEAGPDGDTCVDGQPREEVPSDTFVGKTNNMNWTAGPDGSNAMELGEMRQWIAEAEYNKDRKAHASRLSKALKDGLPADADTELKRDHSLAGRMGGKWAKGYLERLRNSSFNPPTEKPKGRLQNANWTGKSQGKPLIPDTKDIPDTRPHPGAPTMFKQAIGAQKVDPDQKFGKTMRDAQSAGKKLRDNHPEVFGRQIASMLRIKNRDKRHENQDTFDHQMDQQADMWRKALKLPAELKDADAVKGMNEIARGLVQNPEYDLDQWDDDEPIDSGAFGSFTLGDDGIGVKQGYIGPTELAALHAMRDNPAFPNLINARFDGPFKQMSSLYNNPNNVDDERRAPGQQDYWDPDSQSDFDRQFPGAEGKYAMSVANGEQLYNIWDELDEETQAKALDNFWQARAALHQKGFSHNDMHGGNIFVDPETGEVSIIDLGLAKDDPVTALMEATGGMNFEEGNDYQLTHQLSGANLPEEMQERFTSRMADIEEMLMDAFDGDEDDMESMENYNTNIQDLLRGDLRMRKNDVEGLKEVIPKLGDRKFVMSLINRLYDGTAGSELSRRMASAYDDRKQDTDIIRNADRLRAERGEKPLSVRNRNVVPPRNLLDIDD